MFYIPEVKASVDTGKGVYGIAVFNPSESRRLIAKAIAQMPEVKHALENGIVIISRGITNAFLAEEILGIKIEDKSRFTMGCISGGELTSNTGEDRLRPYVLTNGKVSDLSPRDAIKNFDGTSVYIKGANAVDMAGNAGILMSSLEGGSIGEALGLMLARGSHLIIGVGLEKLVPSIVEAAPKCGIFRFKYSTGSPVGMAPLISAKVVTEIQALRIIAGVFSCHVASGGIGGSEGAVVLSLEGSEQQMEKAFTLIKSIKGEPPVAAPKKTTPRASDYNYDAMAVREAIRTGR